MSTTAPLRWAVRWKKLASINAELRWNVKVQACGESMQHTTPTFPRTFATTDPAITRQTCTCLVRLDGVIRQVRVSLHPSVGCRLLYRWLRLPYPARLHLRLRRLNVCRTCKVDRGSTTTRLHRSRTIDSRRTGNSPCTHHSRRLRHKCCLHRNRTGPTTLCRVVNRKSCIREGCTPLCIDATSPSFCEKRTSGRDTISPGRSLLCASQQLFG